MKNYNVVDLFAGAGGESTGIAQAADYSGRKIQLLAVNHWDIAVETHSKNHPWADHLCEDIEVIDPVKAVPGGRVNLLWASPECTHHSRARGGRPRSNQSRASAWLVLKWLQELYCDHVIIENVPDFTSWGPLTATGQPVKRLRGRTFMAYVEALRSLGYRVEWKIMNAANYGAPTTRERLFIQARRAKGNIHWPTQTHVNQRDNKYNAIDKPSWIPARDIIDWSIPGTSIFNRKRPLKEATLKRIEYGIQKYWGEWAEPFLVILRGQSMTRSIDMPLPTISSGGGHVGIVEPFILHQMTTVRPRGINEPLPTITANNGHGIVSPFITTIDNRSSRDGNSSLADPLSTVVTKARHGIVEPFIVQYNGQSKTNEIGNPLGTVTGKDRFGVVDPFIVKLYGTGKTKPVDIPLDTVTGGGNNYALVQGDPVYLDIRFRMFLPHELAAASGFPVDYWFAGTKADQVKQIGNAVPPPFAYNLSLPYMEAA